MKPVRATPLVHLELHTGDLRAASELYERLCGWRSERVRAGSASYVTLGIGGAVEGGIVECATRRPVWLPYVEVPEIDAATERARALGAAVLLEPREGPAGWRSVVATAAGAEIAFWQPRNGTRRKARHP